jgi:hypothetical protein
MEGLLVMRVGLFVSQGDHWIDPHRSPRGDVTLIAVYILELRELSPRLLRGRSCEHHAPSRQLLMSAIDVVRRKRHVRKSADAIFVAGRREQNHLGLAAPNSQFYPALFRVKRLVGQDLES